VCKPIPVHVTGFFRVFCCWKRVGVPDIKRPFLINFYLLYLYRIRNPAERIDLFHFVSERDKSQGAALAKETGLDCRVPVGRSQ
jgi:hypothetical protein